MKPILLSDFLNDHDEKTILSTIFETSVPAMHTWTDFNEIFEILYLLSGYKNPHCALLPDGGSIFLEDVDQAETDCVDLIETFRYRFNVKSLTFVSLDGIDNYYFLLETNHTNPSGLCKNLPKNSISETVAEFEPGVYIDRSFYDNYDYNEARFAYRPRLVNRYLSGSVLIMRNDNPYRRSRISCDGTHAKMNPVEFSAFLKRWIKHLELINA